MCRETISFSGGNFDKYPSLTRAYYHMIPAARKVLSPPPVVPNKAVSNAGRVRTHWKRLRLRQRILCFPHNARLEATNGRGDLALERALGGTKVGVASGTLGDLA